MHQQQAQHQAFAAGILQGQLLSQALGSGSSSSPSTAPLSPTSHAPAAAAAAGDNDRVTISINPDQPLQADGISLNISQEQAQASPGTRTILVNPWLIVRVKRDNLLQSALSQIVSVEEHEYKKVCVYTLILQLHITYTFSYVILYNIFMHMYLLP